MQNDEPQKITRTDSTQPSVLVIDNDPLMLTAMGSVMNAQGYRCVLARTEKIAMDSIAAGQFDVIVLSIDRLEQGCEFAARLRSNELTQDAPIIFLVPELQQSWSTKLAAQGGVFSILKPVEPNGLAELVEKVLWMPHVANSRMGAPTAHLSKQNDWISLPDR